MKIMMQNGLDGETGYYLNFKAMFFNFIKKNKILVFLLTVLLLSIGYGFLLTHKFRNDLMEVKNGKKYFLNSGIYYLYCSEEDSDKLENYNNQVLIHQKEIEINFRKKEIKDINSSSFKLSIDDLELSLINSFEITKQNKYILNKKGFNSFQPKLYIQDNRYEEKLMHYVLIFYIIIAINILYVIFIFIKFIFKKFKKQI